MSLYTSTKETRTWHRKYEIRVNRCRFSYKIEVDALGVKPFLVGVLSAFAGVDVFVSVCLRASFSSVFCMYSSW